MVSVHSLATLTEQMNGNNTRVLTNIAAEQAQDPGPRGQDGQPGQPSGSSPPQVTAGGSASGSVEHGDQGSKLPTESSAGRSGHSRASEGVHDTPHSSALLGPAVDGKLADGASSPDGAVASGTSDSARAHAEGSRQGSERPLAEICAGAQKPSRLGSLLSRIRRRKAPQAPTVSSSSAGGTAERADADGHAAQQSSAAASQPGSPSATPRSFDSAAPKQAIVSQADARPAAGAEASGHSSSAATRSGSESPHGMAAAQAPSQVPALAAVQLDWDKMNESMMHSLHAVISNLTTVLIAQVSTRPCRVPSLNTASSNVRLALADMSPALCKVALSVLVSAQYLSMRFQSGLRQLQAQRLPKAGHVSITLKDQLWQSVRTDEFYMCSRWACKSWQFLG